MTAGRTSPRRFFVAGATGYLGGHLTQELLQRGHSVTALSRSQAGADRLAAAGAQPVVAEATEPGALTGLLDGIDAVVSALGITRQRDGLTYEDVDYRANVHLLRAAEEAGVQHFGYVSVYRGPELAHTAMVGAKERFVAELTASSIDALVIRPTGFFSDMEQVYAMAEQGRVWVFGDGSQELNPIAGEDLAVVIADAMESGEVGDLDAGGPETMTFWEIGAAAFAALDRAPRISSVPKWLASTLGRAVPRVTPRTVSGPVEFLLAGSRLRMVAPHYGSHRLADHFAQLAEQPSTE